MWNLFQSASDDQVALLGCAGVLFTSMFLMYVSYFLGPVARQERQNQMESLIRNRQKLLEQATAETLRDKAA